MGRIRVVLASRNEHKLRELRQLLPDWDLEPLGVGEMPPETGATFYENARAKADYAQSAAEPGRWVLGEDSGIEVEALGGGPGIRSARYAGPHATDRENVAKLLGELAGVEGEARRARYVSELVLLAPELERRGTGTLGGHIAEEPRGSGGFGYDPVFVPEAEERTVAELGDGWKRDHSHRARAVRSLLAALGEGGEEL